MVSSRSMTTDKHFSHSNNAMLCYATKPRLLLRLILLSDPPHPQLKRLNRPFELSLPDNNSSRPYRTQETYIKALPAALALLIEAFLFIQFALRKASSYTADDSRCIEREISQVKGDGDEGIGVSFRAEQC
jgi:hypothetical protein